MVLNVVDNHASILLFKKNTKNTCGIRKESSSDPETKFGQAQGKTVLQLFSTENISTHLLKNSREPHHQPHDTSLEQEVTLPNSLGNLRKYRL